MTKRSLIAVFLSTMIFLTMGSCLQPAQAYSDMAGLHSATKSATHTATVSARQSASRSNHWRDSNSRIWGSTPRWIRDTGYCIRKHESITAGHYNALNRSSGSSGAYQYISGTWRHVSRNAGYGGYSTARSAPPSVQDAVFIYHVKHYGLSAWHGTWCSGT